MTAKTHVSKRTAPSKTVSIRGAQASRVAMPLRNAERLIILKQAAGVAADKKSKRIGGRISATGILSRTQNRAAADRRLLLHDALIAATALKKGLVVLTANVADFDLLSQIQPATRVLYYAPV